LGALLSAYRKNATKRRTSMTQKSPFLITPTTLKQWLHDGSEIALLDVREHGQYGEEHLFYVVSVPYSKLETEAERLVPRKQVRMVLVGDESGALSLKASKRLAAIGYTNVHILDGGMPAWKKAGYEVFAGVNLPSKAFGELAEHAFNTPRISAKELSEKIQNNENLIVIDGRPFTEYKKMSIPTAMCCPNGELPLRIDDIVTDPQTTIVINCAGRTRSIIGAQTLINLGIPNKVLALENGTQGWYLEDLKLDHGQTKKHSLDIGQKSLAERQTRAKSLAQKHGVKFVDSATVEQWRQDNQRTTFICDVRTPEEYAQGTVQGAKHCPGGQLVQATDQYVGVKGARLVLVDAEGVRAPAMASWLAMLGWDVSVWEQALETTCASQNESSDQSPKQDVKELLAGQIEAHLKTGALLVDLRPSMQYRLGHIKNAIWSVRPQLYQLAEKLKGHAVILLADEKNTAHLAALDLKELGVQELYINTQQLADWEAENLPIEETPNNPPDAQCIDYLFFVHDRHDGNKAAARQYLAWEMNLLAQIDEQEKAAFKLPH
jgi:rhodanese-related sulfurtransferase